MGNPDDVLSSGPILKVDYYPGDNGFDLLGLKPDDPEEFAILHAKELQNGCVAILGAADMIAR